MTQGTRQFQVAATKCLFDELIDSHAEAYVAAFPEIKEFSPFERSGTYNYYIGMIWTNDNEKPNTDQIRLRGSYSMTKNKMVELDLKCVQDQFSFFPGQIVAFLAEPFQRSRLTVKRFLDPMRIVPSPKPINMKQDMNILIACGPFMKPEEKEWTLFDKLIGVIKTRTPSHIILLGPFVDMDNKKMQSRYEMSWREFMNPLMEATCQYPAQVYLVPSNRDILYHEIGGGYCYPSPKLIIKHDLKEDAKPKCRFIPVEDPAHIDLGGLVVDVTSAEVLFHMNKCTTFINRGAVNPFTAMYKHLLVQGIYPLYPQPSDFAVDFAKLRPHLVPTRDGPHIMVLPSRFTTAANSVEDRVVATIHKCSIKKHVLLIDVPQITSTEENCNTSVVASGFKFQTIDLMPGENNSQSSSSSSASAPKQDASNNVQMSSETSQPVAVESA